MQRAVVIKTVGDPQIAAAIVDGMTRNVTTLSADEYATIRAELARLRAKDAVRSYGDERRFESVSNALAVKYASKPTGKVYGAILTAWACLWMAVYGMGEYLMELNRR